MEHTPPVGLIAKFMRWVGEFIAMPGRIKLLAEGLEADRDPRPTCTKCGTGRVAADGWRNSSGYPYEVGKCVGCGQLWQIHDAGRKLTGMWNGGAH